MTICKFWRQGTCKFGNQCRFEHPPGVGPQVPQPGRRSQNRSPPGTNHYGLSERIALDHATERKTSPGWSSSKASKGHSTYGLTHRILLEDLRNERPTWLMSAYGPGKDAPVQLFGGDLLEQSPEEVRVLHYHAVLMGNTQQSAQYEAELAERSNQQVRMVLEDPAGALQYLARGEHEHPNRRDICQATTVHKSANGVFSRHVQRDRIRNEQKRFTRPNVAFGEHNVLRWNPSQNTSLAHNTRTAGGMNSGGFGEPIPSTQQQQAFVDVPRTAIVAPASILGQGQQFPPNQPHPVAMSLNSFGEMPPTLTSSFGQGQSSNGIPFDTPQQHQFQPSANQHGGEHPHPKNNTSLPHQESQFANDYPRPTYLSNPNLSGNGGHRPDFITDLADVTLANSSLALPAHTRTNDMITHPGATRQEMATRDQSGRLTSWKGRPVTYIDGNTPCYQTQNNNLERIWFPNGPPPASSTTAIDDGFYDNDVDNDVAQIYLSVKETGIFADCRIPLVAPSRNMVRWDV